MKRFIDAQTRDFTKALAEIQRGRKVSHWMWYIFPQLRGLGHSSTAQYYGLDGLREARAFATEERLIGNLRAITKTLLAQPRRNAHAIFGNTDAMKLRSCMTLFEIADPDCSLYAQVLDEFFGGNRDQKTLDLLK